MKKMSNKFIFIWLYFCIFLLTFTLVSCGESGIKQYTPLKHIGGDGFKTFVSIPDTPYFSFEYPPDYQIINETQGNNNPFLHLGLFGVIKEENDHQKVKRIDIFITNYNTKWLGFPDAQTSMKEYISGRKWSPIRNYRLVERHKAVMDGVEGWETIITFRERAVFPLWRIVQSDPAFIVARDLFFDYQGMTWQISLYTDVDSYKQQTKEDFEHILQTFKFSE